MRIKINLNAATDRQVQIQPALRTSSGINCPSRPPPRSARTRCSSRRSSSSTCTRRATCHSTSFSEQWPRSEWSVAHQNMASIFSHYDQDKKGRINYRLFCGKLLNLQIQKDDDAKSERDDLDRSLDTLNTSLIEKGMASILELGVMFKMADESKSHHVNCAAFSSVLQSFKLGLKKASLAEVFKYFDKDNDGYINYGQFLYMVRGQMNAFRTSLTKSIFEQLDRGRNEVQIASILSNFQGPSKADFELAIVRYGEFQGIEDGFFTDQDFLDFIGFVSYYYSTDEKFREFLVHSFQNEDRKSVRSSKSRREFSQKDREELKPRSQSQKNIDLPVSPAKHDLESDFKKKPTAVLAPAGSSAPSKHQREPSVASSAQVKLIEMVVLRVKNRLASRGPIGFLSFCNSMRHADLDTDGLLSLPQFRKVLKDHRIDVTEIEVEQVFDLFDDKGFGRVQIKEVFQTLRGFPNQRRLRLVDRLWSCLDRDGSGLTNYSILKSQLNPRTHPDVKSGRKDEDAVLKQVFDSVLLVQDMSPQGRSQDISRAQFDQLLRCISGATPEDQLFEVILKSLFRMPSETKIEEQYAGSKNLFDVDKKMGYLTDHHRQRVKGGSVSENAPFGTFSQKTDYAYRHFQ